MSKAPDKLTIHTVDFHNADHRRDLADMLIAYSEDEMGGGKALDRELADASVALIANRPYAVSFLCYIDDKAVAFANCFETVATFAAAPAINIHDLAVIAEFRGRGIAGKMLQAIETYARQHACYKLTLEVLEGNMNARRTYERAGFSAYRLKPQHGHALFWQKVIA